MGDSWRSRVVSTVGGTSGGFDVRSVRTMVARTSMISFLGFSGGWLLYRLMRELRFDPARGLSRAGDSVSADEKDALLAGRLLHWAEEERDIAALLNGKLR